MSARRRLRASLRALALAAVATAAPARAASMQMAEQVRADYGALAVRDDHDPSVAGLAQVREHPFVSRW